MNKQELTDAGQILFPGRNWKGNLAVALEVHRSTIKRWVKGEFNIPEDKACEIRGLVTDKLKSLERAVRKMRK